MVNIFLLNAFCHHFFTSALGVFSLKKGVGIQFEFNSSHAERPARTDEISRVMG